MHLPRRLRETADVEDIDEDDGEDAETFRDLLLEALADPEVQAVIRRLAAPAKTPEPRAARRR